MRYYSSNNLYVAFSGGEDSTLVALIAREALGKDRVQLVTVDWGQFTYARSRKIVSQLALEIGLPHRFIAGSGTQKKIWKHGPSCSSCTRNVKLGLIKNIAKDGLIATGANQSDSWGRTGIKLNGNVFSPLLELSKEDIRYFLDHFGFNVPKIGESVDREGCKLKHLLKMMINEEYHGRAVCESNELLLSYLGARSWNAKLANVKIVGPLSKNIALVNVVPHLSEKYAAELRTLLNSLECVDEVHVVNRPVKLRVLANPGLFNDSTARSHVHMGVIQKEFAAPVEITWIESSNKRLRTFQVISFAFQR